MNEQILTLPKLVKETTTPKATIIKQPDVSMLNEKQLEIFEQITNMKLNVFSQTLLTGYSGTGKSFFSYQNN